MDLSELLLDIEKTTDETQICHPHNEDKAKKSKEAFFSTIMMVKAIEGLACNNMGEYYTCCRKTFVQGAGCVHSFYSVLQCR